MPCCLNAFSFVFELKICFFHKRGFVLGEVHWFYFFHLLVFLHKRLDLSSSRTFLLTFFPSCSPQNFYPNTVLHPLISPLRLYRHHHPLLMISREVFHKRRRKEQVFSTNRPRDMHLIHTVPHPEPAVFLSQI